MTEFQSSSDYCWERRNEKGGEGRIGNWGKQCNRGSTFSGENNDIPTYLWEQAFI
jgi:hypothetical protein